MLTKLRAARNCMAAGIPLVIANSAEENVIRRVIAGDDLGTVFVPREEKMPARMKWIAFGTVPHGKIIVDPGAQTALLKRGKSLLPTGVLNVEGEFERGEVVAVLDSSQKEIARGMANYNSQETRQIAGKKTSQIEEILGASDYDEVIHRNNLWITY
jgi:glutamate 5-kinase